MSRGSSPLARGLPALTFTVPAYQGIIPARAGFTTSPSSVPRAVKDHPRSRGVYHFPSPFCVGPVWIIPARAGFTYRPF